MAQQARKGSSSAPTSATISSLSSPTPLSSSPVLPSPPNILLDETYRRIRNSQQLMTQLQTLLTNCHELEDQIVKAREHEQALVETNQQYREMADALVLENRERELQRKQLTRMLEIKHKELIQQKEAMVRERNRELGVVVQNVRQQDHKLRGLQRQEKKLKLLLGHVEPLETETDFSVATKLAETKVLGVFTSTYDKVDNKADEFVNSHQTELREFLALAQPMAEVSPMLNGNFEPIALENGQPVDAFVAEKSRRDISTSQSMVRPSPRLAIDRPPHISLEDLRQLNSAPSTAGGVPGVDGLSEASSTTRAESAQT